MTSSFYYVVDQYKQTGDLSQMIDRNDNIFASDKGIFISRGSIAKFPQNEITSELANLTGTNSNDTKPFIVFSRPFEKLSSENVEADMPQQMIHIDSHNWVTHFFLARIGEEINRSAYIASPVEPPHHIELMSPESKDQFTDKVEQVLKHIEVGDITKAVIARQLNVSADNEIDPRLLISELLDSQPGSFIFSINGFVGASPELLVQKFSRSIKCLPMAGTRKRHARIDEDDADIADLQTNIKDHYEHSVVIEDIVEKLELVGQNVTSSQVPHVVRLPHVAHLATSVTATANNEIDLMDLVTTLHPTPAVAGTPTTQAMELIADIEEFDRGIYGAPVGWVDSSGDGQCAIALRCAKLEGSHARLFAGVGIVAGSNPTKEWNETQAKFGVMRDAMMNITQ